MMSWSLALATYERREVLEQCVRCVLAQTFLPKEIVIVDGSRLWHENMVAVESLLQSVPAIKLVYEEALVRSAAAQRNQAADRCTAEVLFFIDDDTLMYPDCAERIMEVYNADKNKMIAAVAGANVAESPLNCSSSSEATPLSSSPGGGVLKKAARSVLKANDRFLPYEDKFPSHDVPQFLTDFNVAFCRTLPGFSLTMRRSIATREKFDNRLLRYSAEEDSDITYRASRSGLLLKSLDAKLHHIGSPGGRLSTYTTTALTAINLVFLHRINSPDLKSSKFRLWKFLLRRSMIEAAKDVYYRDPLFPRFRGIIRGVYSIGTLLNANMQNSVQKFCSMQEKLVLNK
ncbi:glycosyltransferase family 2 protein [uncultured Microbulbifer sp.]|uniref:glycosyltransferase family 2 protein n=1 Tax=uncultured Microbulbifer sp. TaxID=348147 RepID=UPI002625AFA9|nr:glycosyltransferase family 2 protein [uncultured Microbulbifer sp.]